MISEIDIRDWGDYPTKPIETKEQYEWYLSCFDWFYEYSDDYNIWKRWNAAKKHLLEAAGLFDRDRAIWRVYALPR